MTESIIIIIIIIIIMYSFNKIIMYSLYMIILKHYNSRNNS